MASTTIFKFYPASPAVGLMFGAGGRTLKSIGSDLNQGGGAKVTIKFNDPVFEERYKPGQFVIISNDREKAETAYSELRKVENEAINGHVTLLPGGETKAEGGWWSKALGKQTDAESVTYTHELIKSLAGVVLGKGSVNLEQARKNHFEVDIQVSNPDNKTCLVTYTAPTEHAEKAWAALLELRTIERAAFKDSQSRRLDSAARKETPVGLDDGLGVVVEV